MLIIYLEGLAFEYLQLDSTCCRESLLGKAIDKFGPKWIVPLFLSGITQLPS